MRPIPESAHRKDWPRLVAQKLNKLENTISSLSTTTGSGSMDLGDSGPQGEAAMDLGDSA